ncbi:MAG: sensor histidine kinase [Flavobacteriaceae bacterium]|nr:sensor histidine kinase [Flavobacteriaceae bacterium]
MTLRTQKSHSGFTGESQISLKHHIIFWSVYFILNTLRWGSFFNDYNYALKTGILGFMIHMSLSYFNIYYLMPKFVFKKKYLTYIILLIIALFVGLLFKFNLTYFLISHNVWPEGPEVINHLTLNYSIDMMIGELYVVTFVTAIKITLDWIYEHKRVADLEKVNLETELMFLRSQISPHFFFNTLNNIYALSLEKSEKTPQIIMKLSELMRYLLYQTKNKRISLEKEILCIQNYLDLERLRYGQQLELEMNITGDIEDKEIAPLLLLSFIENSFKHGINKSIGKVKIIIDFKIVNDFLYFSISNPTPKLKNRNQLNKKPVGIGIKNVKKRLELGYNKEDYDLKINSDENNFYVNFKIKV